MLLSPEACRTLTKDKEELSLMAINTSAQMRRRKSPVRVKLLLGKGVSSRRNEHE